MNLSAVYVEPLIKGELAGPCQHLGDDALRKFSVDFAMHEVDVCRNMEPSFPSYEILLLQITSYLVVNI